MTNRLKFNNQSAKNRNFCLFLLAIISISLNSCKSTLPPVFFDNNYIPVKEVSISPYTSVQSRPNQDSTLAFGVAASGGGSRAQYFTLGVLMGLEKISDGKTNLLREMDYASSVSGGGYALGYYFVLKKYGVLDRYQSFFDFWKSNDHYDLLPEYIFQKTHKYQIVNVPLFESKVGYKKYLKALSHDCLQEGKVFYKDTIKPLKLSDFFSPKGTAPAQLPMYVCNGTIYNNSERLPMMPHVLSSFRINGTQSPQGNLPMASNGYGLPLLYAVTASASFPGLLPTVNFTLDSTKNILRVYDGGAVDNLGYLTLLELLNSENRVPNNKKRAVLINSSSLGKAEQLMDRKQLKLLSMFEKFALTSVKPPHF
ncbi:MAG: patatin-like phospholipase family protein [Chitinophagales bacterium]